MNFVSFVLAFLLIFLLASAPATAVPHRQALDRKSNLFLSEGVFVGGRSGTSFTLLDIRRSFDKALNTERIVLDWGDAKGLPLKGSIGFFHVGIDKNTRRVVVELAQVVQASMDEAAVMNRLKSSRLLKSSQMIYDPIAGSTQLILDFKGPVGIEAFYLTDRSNPSRLVLDVRPLQAGGAVKSIKTR